MGFYKDGKWVEEITDNGGITESGAKDHVISKLKDRITELEQQLADANIRRSNHSLAASIAEKRYTEAEAKLTERDKLLDKCWKYMKGELDFDAAESLYQLFLEREK